MARESLIPPPTGLWRLLAILLTMTLFISTAAHANPVMLNPTSLLAFSIVAFWAMVVAAGVVALLLAFRGAAALPVFAGYFVLNGAVWWC